MQVRFDGTMAHILRLRLLGQHGWHSPMTKLGSRFFVCRGTELVSEGALNDQSCPHPGCELCRKSVEVTSVKFRMPATLSCHVKSSSLYCKGEKDGKSHLDQHIVGTFQAPPQVQKLGQMKVQPRGFRNCTLSSKVLFGVSR